MTSEKAAPLSCGTPAASVGERGCMEATSGGTQVEGG